MNAATLLAKFIVFRSRYNGRAVDFDNAYGYQCMDLVELWSQYIGKGRIGGNAIDLPSRGPQAGYQFIANSPTNHPNFGDIVCFGAVYGRYGHTGIAASANTNTLNCFQQNNPLGSASHQINNMSYHGVVGWLRPL